MNVIVPGDLGCSIDAVTFLDKACSGKESCEFFVANPELAATKPCVSDRYPYLEVEFQCIEGTVEINPYISIATQHPKKKSILPAVYQVNIGEANVPH